MTFKKINWGTGKRKPDDETKNKIPNHRKKKLKPTDELEKYIKETESRIETELEHVTSQHESFRKQLGKRKRDDDETKHKRQEPRQDGNSEGGLILTIRNIINKPCYKMRKLPFQFKNNDNAAQKNARILETHSWNL